MEKVIPQKQESIISFVQGIKAMIDFAEEQSDIHHKENYEFFNEKRLNLEKVIKKQKSPALAIHSIHDKKVPISNVDILLMDSNFKKVIKVETKGHNGCVKDERFWENVFLFITSNEMDVIDKT